MSCQYFNSIFHKILAYRNLLSWIPKLLERQFEEMFQEFNLSSFWCDRSGIQYVNDKQTDLIRKRNVSVQNHKQRA